MNAQTAKIEADPLALLRAPFKPNQISKLPKPTKAQTEAVKADFKAGIRCQECGAWHHPKVEHLDYVGHAALTDRLLDVDPHWTWEPMGRTPEGLPVIAGGLWIKLTVCGVSRFGFGAADGKSGGDAIKEMIGDALRNAAMRFGAALDLWHKGDLHADDGADEGQSQTGAVSPPAPDEMPDHEWAKLAQLIKATNADTGAMCKRYGVTNLRQLNQASYADAIEKLDRKLAKAAKDETNAKASTLAEELGDEIQF